MIKFYENEPYSPIEYAYEVDRVLYKGKSKYQNILVIENPHFGRMLILDNIVQLTERDEFFYHEMLTHIVMHAHPNPRRIAVIGGGDGGVVREVLKHESVEKVFFVELDKEVIEISKRFFPQVSLGIDDPRVEIRINDGAEFIKHDAKDIDVIIVDSTDIIGFARSLFTIDFFTDVLKALTNQGLFVTHSESLHFHLDVVIEVQNVMNKTFPIVDLYSTSIATYPGNWWAFSVGSKELDPREVRRSCVKGTKYYDEEIHKHAFLPRRLYKRILEREVKW